jgi:hypothetical protein
MKRCPKCNRTFTTDTQKFCTHDGGILEGFVDMQQPDTVRIDSAPLEDDAPTKAISAETVMGIKPDFDPFKTVISRPETTIVDKLDNTQGGSSPVTTSIPAGQSPSTPLPGSGQISQPPPPPNPAPPPPRQSSPSAPTMALTGTSPVMAASVPPPPAQVNQPSPQPTTAPPARKKSRLPLVLGILAVLLLFGGAALGAVYWFVARPMLAARRVVLVDAPRPPTQAPPPNIEATPGEVPKTAPIVAPEPPPYNPPADAVQFVNSKENLDGKLAEHYVEFSFYYPERWQKDPTAGVPGATNFAKVERRIPPDFTQENFAVGSYVSAGSAEGDRAVFPNVAENLSSQLAKKFPGYRKVSEGVTKVGVYDGYGFRFEGMSKNTAKGDLKFWGRVIFLPPTDGSKDGVTLLMLATSLASELKSVDDVGAKGELPMLLESFRFGKK